MDGDNETVVNTISKSFSYSAIFAECQTIGC